MRNIILYREGDDWQNEKEAAEKNFITTKSRMDIKAGDLVIPRFSAMPFYKEQEYDVSCVGAKMINSIKQHNYIVDMYNWYEDLIDLTPKTYRRLVDLPENGPFILKGETNSKKFLWKTHMFAADKKAAIEVESRLHNDSLITYQNIYIREYVKLKTFMIGLQDLPITNEYRFFCYKDTILSGGYYWSSHVENLKERNININVSQVPESFLKKVMSRVKDKVNFYVIDVAETENGDWVVVELNLGEQAGTSENDPMNIYSNLRRELEKK